MTSQPSPSIPPLSPASTIPTSHSTSSDYREKSSETHSYLLCLDPADSGASKLALEYAKDRLALPGDYVVLLAVLPARMKDASPGPRLGVSAGNGAAPEWYFQEQEGTAKGDATRKAAAVKNLEASAAGFKPGVSVHLRLAYGDAVPQIIEARDFYDSDMVITGRRKMNRLQRWVSSGSVSTALLTNSDCSVLVVR